MVKSGMQIEMARSPKQTVVCDEKNRCCTNMTQGPSPLQPAHKRADGQTLWVREPTEMVFR